MNEKPDVSWCEKGGARGYITTRPLEWDIGKENSGWEFIVPSEREFESSVPFILQWFWSPDDPYFLKAACIHDALIEDGYRTAFADSQWFEAALSVRLENMDRLYGHAHPSVFLLDYRAATPLTGGHGAFEHLATRGQSSHT